MSEEIVNRKTPFKKFTVQKARVCRECRDFIHKGTQAWKPSRGEGGWLKDTVLCDACVRGG